MRSRTHDTSHYGLQYVSGMLRMESQRNMANIGRKTHVSYQNLQHFMSHSPWSAQALIRRVQAAMMGRDELGSGCMLLLDESADDKAGQHSVGASRQYNGRRGKVDQCQVGVFLTLAKGQFSTWIDGEVYLPQAWFEDDKAQLRQQVGLGAERRFMTKPQLGWQMIERVRAQGLEFEAVGCDGLYGHSVWFRDQLAEAEIEYYADVPSNTRVYLSQPLIGLPPKQKGRKPATKERVLSPNATRVDQLRRQGDTRWQAVELRASERGILTSDFSLRAVWTVGSDLRVRQELLIMRRSGQKCSYSLSNAPEDTPLALLAGRKSQRFFIERSIQDAKSEYGWDEFQATKLLAWEHQLALTILAAWFIAELKLDWATEHQRDPALLADYDIKVLPSLSVANVRLLLCAAMPLPQLGPGQAADLVIEHLLNRIHSRKSRLKHLTFDLGP